jgi:hypothetical protein
VSHVVEVGRANPIFIIKIVRDDTTLALMQPNEVEELKRSTWRLKLVE